MMKEVVSLPFTECTTAATPFFRLACDIYDYLSEVIQKTTPQDEDDAGHARHDSIKVAMAQAHRLGPLSRDLREPNAPGVGAIQVAVQNAINASVGTIRHGDDAWVRAIQSLADALESHAELDCASC